MRGHLEVICGCMFAGKTTELIRRLDAVRDAGLPVISFKHAIDTRDRPTEIVSHDGRRFPSRPVDSAEQLLSAVDHAHVIGIDEAQFFTDALVSACADLTSAGRRVIVAGLDRTCFGEPFEPVPTLCAAADDVARLRARCARCGASARYTQRLLADVGPDDARRTDPVLVGGDERYEPRCAACFAPFSRR